MLASAGAVAIAVVLGSLAAAAVGVAVSAVVLAARLPSLFGTPSTT